VPAEFKPLAQLQAPYRILNPGWGGFDSGGAQQDYYKAYIDQIWATDHLTIPKADYHAKFMHDSAINGKAYGFPYDDVGGYSSYIAHDNPQYMPVAIGW